MIIRKGANWYWVYWSKSWSWNDENAIDFRWSDVKEEDEEDIPLANFIESLQKQADEEKKMIVWWLQYHTLWKEKLKRSFFEVISNTKMFNIKFCETKMRTTKILSNLQGGLDKGGD